MTLTPLILIGTVAAVVCRARRYPGRLVQERAKKTNRTQLEREIEAVACRTQSLNVTEIGVIETEISGELESDSNGGV